MSVKIMAQVWSSGPADRSELLVLLALADHANDAGECWPAVASIAEKARMTERAVQKISARLVARGYLEIHTGGGRHGTNFYRINPEPETPNGVHPEPETPFLRTETPNGKTETPNRGSPEPSRTIIEPSVNKTRTRKSRIPEDAVISERQREIADREGISQKEAEAQFDRFKDSALANGRMYVDWDRAWRSWLRSPYFRPVFKAIKAIPGGKDADSDRDPEFDRIFAAARMRRTQG